MVDKVTDGGSWNDSASWSPTGVPTSSDDATIAGDAGYFILDGIAGTADSLTVSAGTATLSLQDDTLTVGTTISNSGSISAQTGSMISAGTFANAGAVTLIGDSTITTTGGFTNDGHVENYFTGDTIGGTFTNDSDGTISVGSGSLAFTGDVNDAGAVTIASNATLTNSGTWNLTGPGLGSITLGSGEGTFVNDGTFIGGGGLSDDIVDVEFVNSGASTISVAGLVTLEFTQGLDDAGSISLNGSGFLEFPGVLELDGGTSTIAGLVSGGGTFEVAGGDVTLAAGTSLTAADFDLSGGTATIATDLTYAGSYAQSGGVLDILSGDTLTLSGLNDSFTGGTIIGGGRLVNKGTLTSSNTLSGTNTIAAGFTNDAGASISVTSGTLDLTGGFGDAGSVSIASGATLELDGGTSTISGALNGSGTLAIAGGTTTITTDLTYAGTYDQSGGVLNVEDGAALTLDGPGATISGGTLTISAGTLVQETGLSISGGGSIVNDGDFFQYGDTSLSGGTGILNENSYLIDGGTISGTGVFANGGGFISEGSSEVGTTFFNEGLIGVGSGTLAFTGPVADNGLATIVAGATLTSSGSWYMISSSGNGASILGAGNFVNSGTFTSLGVAETSGTNFVAAPFTNIASGVIVAEYGATLAFTGAVVDSGSTTIDSGTTIISSDAWSLDNASIAGSGTFVNNGFFASNSSADGTNTISPNFVNNGSATVRVTGGTLDLTGGVSDSGRVTVNQGSVFELDGGTSTISGLIGGKGAFEVGGGDVTLAAGASITTADFGVNFAELTVATNLSYAGFFDQYGGELNIRRGNTLTLSGTSEYIDNVTIVGHGTLLNAGRLYLNSEDVANTTTLSNAGTISQESGSLFLSDGASVLNQTGGIYGLTNGSIYNGSAAGNVVNDGRFISSTSSTNAIEPYFVSSGTISVSSGVLDVTGGINDTGSVTIADASTLKLDGGTSTISGPISGSSGTLEIAGGTVTFAAGASIATGEFRLYGGTATIATDLTLAGGYYQGSGTLDLAAGEALILTKTYGNTLSGGTITGSGLLLNRGGLAIYDGTLSGSAILRNGQGGSLLQIGGDLTLDDTAKVENSVGGVYEMGSSATLSGSAGTSLVNGGSFISSNGTNVVAAPFTNMTTGTISVAAGILDVTGGFNDTGSVTLAADTQFELDGGTSTIAGLISGASSAILDVFGGAVTFAAGASITTGEIRLYGGTATIATDLTYAGLYQQSDSGTLDLASGEALILTYGGTLGGGTITGGGLLLNRGQLQIENDGLTTTVTGDAILRNGTTGTIEQSGTLTLDDTAKVENSVGGVYEMGSSATVSGSAGTSLVNGGSFISSNGTNVVAAPFTNMSTGTISVAAGILAFQGVVTDDGATTIAGGATLTNSGNWNLDNAGIAGPGTFENTGTFTGVTGTNTIASAFTNEVGGTIAVASGTLVFTGDVTDYGTTTIDTPVESATLVSRGTWNLDSTSISSNGYGTFVNDGRFISSGSAGTNTVAPAFINTSGGTISVTGALDTLAFTGGLADTGSVSIDEPDKLSLAGGTSTIAALIGGSGALVVAGGTATFATGANLTMDAFNLAGGTAAIATDLTYSGFYDQTGGTLDLAGGAALILTGPPANAVQSGTITGSGLLLNRGALFISGGELSGSAILRNGTTGTIYQVSDLFLAGSAMVQNSPGGVYDLDDASIYLDDGTGASFVNGGLFTSAGPFDATNTIVPAFVNNSTGTISVVDATLAFTGGLDDLGSVTISTPSNGPAELKLDGGSSTIAGSVSGASGTLAITGGTATFTAGASLTMGEFDLSGGTAAIATDLTYAGIYTQDGGTLALASGEALILTGTSNMLIAGTVGGSGVLLNRGELDIFSGTVTDGAILRNGTTGTILQYGDLDVSDAAMVQNSSGGVYVLENNSALLDEPETTSFVNGGSFISGSSATNTVAIDFTNNSTGSVTVTSGTLDFDRIVSDAGTVTIDGGTALTNDDDWLLTGGASIFGPGVFLNGKYFVNEAGTNTVAASFINETLIEVDAGTLAFTGVVTDHDATRIAAGATVMSGGTWNLDNTAISGATGGGAGTFVNAGSFVSTATSSITNTVAPAFTNTGSVTVASGSLDLTGGFDDSGSVIIAGTALELDGGTGTVSGTISGSGLLNIAGGEVSFIAGADLAMTSFELSGGTAMIATDLSYSGAYFQNGGTLDLGTADTLTLAGSGNTLTGGLVDGSGVLLNAGTLAIDGLGVAIDGSATLDNGVGATINQGYDLTVGAMATVENQGTYNLDGAAILQSGTGASVVNDGNFVFNATTLENISAAVTNNAGATLTAQSGSLDLSNSAGVTNSGTIAADTGSISIAGALTGTGADELSGAASLSLGGSVSSGQTVTFETGATGTLDLGQAQSFAGTVAGLTHSNAIDLTNFLFSGGPTITGITGTGVMGTTTDVTIKDGTQLATIDLLNQATNQYSTNPNAYSLISDNRTPNAGTTFELAPPI